MVKKNDFIEIEYTASLKEGNSVFDTTDKSVAEKNKLQASKSVVIPLGQGLFLQGLEDALEGKSLGIHTVELQAEKAFGKKSTQLIKLVPTNKLQQQNIRPVPGLQLNIDGMLGTVKAVSGGRTIIDFNHPLSGKDVIYKVDIKRVVTDKKEQVQSLFNIFNIPVDSVTVDGLKAIVKAKEKLPVLLQKEVDGKVKELTGISVLFS
ncbi:FKBP-type peptidyl-prolyl cis-trans isomerase [Candidatus Woesearchaeota archaeon]|nr:FKBP-type peptidyl-prolyl cis-trans isomerase [Candidatus Woesearchaeota archaeon]